MLHFPQSYPKITRISGANENSDVDLNFDRLSKVYFPTADGYDTLYKGKISSKQKGDYDNHLYGMTEYHMPPLIRKYRFSKLAIERFVKKRFIKNYHEAR